MGTYSTGARNWMLDAWDSYLSSGATASATLNLYSTASALVATCAFSATPYGAASAASMTANAIAAGTAASAAELGYATIVNGLAEEGVELSLATSSAEVIVNNTTVASGASITVSSLVTTCPAS